MKKHIILACDHAGFELKEKIKIFLSAKDYEILDVGAHHIDPSDDYPTYMSEASLKVAQDMSGNSMAILFGKTGQGEAIVANRFPGVRAVVWYGGNEEIIRLSREHNDSNILSIGAGFVTDEEVKHAIEIWLNTNFSNEDRHKRRIIEIDNIG